MEASLTASFAGAAREVTIFVCVVMLRSTV
jgi:hypothetical protein